MTKVGEVLLIAAYENLARLSECFLTGPISRALPKQDRGRTHVFLKFITKRVKFLGNVSKVILVTSCM